MSSKKVAKVEETQLDLYSEDRPAFLGDSERGSDNVTVDDLTIPRIEIIQDLSPQRKKNEAEYIDGAEEGMVYNTVSNALYADAQTSGIMVIPVYFRIEYLVWRDRNKGGGFEGSFDTEAEAVAYLESADCEDPNDCEIQKTDQQFSMVLSPEGKWEAAVISMSKSKLKASRQWNSLINMAGGDRFSRVYRLSTVTVDGQKGAYFNWKASPVGYVTEDAYRKAEELYEAVVRGQRGVSYSEGGSKQEEVADTIG